MCVLDCVCVLGVKETGVKEIRQMCVLDCVCVLGVKETGDKEIRQMCVLDCVCVLGVKETGDREIRQMCVLDCVCVLGVKETGDREIRQVHWSIILLALVMSFHTSSLPFTPLHSFLMFECLNGFLISTFKFPWCGRGGVRSRGRGISRARQGRRPFPRGCRDGGQSLRRGGRRGR